MNDVPLGDAETRKAEVYGADLKDSPDSRRIGPFSNAAPAHFDAILSQTIPPLLRCLAASQHCLL
ncbi:hypothetical protein [Leisingera sp.]|uniref:hypothetical protein n=1 Tax=Leisingera sp. TaxID=1879318 RepID=UPI002B26FAA5|nr:hypothetical protein [Leisingera sp.]